MNNYANMQSGILKTDYGQPKNATEAALKKRREELYKTKMEPLKSKLEDVSEDDI